MAISTHARAKSTGEPWRGWLSCFAPFVHFISLFAQSSTSHHHRADHVGQVYVAPGAVRLTRNSSLVLCCPTPPKRLPSALSEVRCTPLCKCSSQR